MSGEGAGSEMNAGALTRAGGATSPNGRGMQSEGGDGDLASVAALGQMLVARGDF